MLLPELPLLPLLPVPHRVLVLSLFNFNPAPSLGSLGPGFFFWLSLHNGHHHSEMTSPLLRRLHWLPMALLLTANVSSTPPVHLTPGKEFDVLRLTQPSKRGTLTSISRMKKLGDDTQVLTLSASLSPTQLWKVSPLLPKCLVSGEPAFAGRALRAAGDVEASLGLFGLPGGSWRTCRSQTYPPSHSSGPVPRVLLRHLLIVRCTLCPCWPASLGRRPPAACTGLSPLPLSWEGRVVQGLWASSGDLPRGACAQHIPRLGWGCLTAGPGPWLPISGSNSLLTFISSLR